MNLSPDSLQLERDKLACELADVRTQMEQLPTPCHRLEFRAAELAVRIEQLDARLQMQRSPASTLESHASDQL